MNHDTQLAILEDEYKLSLMCPVTKTKIKIPAKGLNCEHLECFDLRPFLELFYLNSAAPSCPICKKPLPQKILRIDSFVEGLLSSSKAAKLAEVNLEKVGILTSFFD